MTSVLKCYFWTFRCSRKLDTHQQIIFGIDVDSDSADYLKQSIIKWQSCAAIFLLASHKNQQEKLNCTGWLNIHGSSSMYFLSWTQNILPFTEIKIPYIFIYLFNGSRLMVMLFKAWCVELMLREGPLFFPRFYIPQRTCQ